MATRSASLGYVTLCALFIGIVSTIPCHSVTNKTPLLHLHSHRPVPAQPVSPPSLHRSSSLQASNFSSSLRGMYEQHHCKIQGCFSVRPVNTLLCFVQELIKSVQKLCAMAAKVVGSRGPSSLRECNRHATLHDVRRNLPRSKHPASSRLKTILCSGGVR